MARRRRRIPAASLHVMICLLEGEKHGYAIMRDVEDLTDGVVKMGPGTLYGTLNRLVTDGFIEEVDSPDDVGSDGERRRYYRLTADGTGATAQELTHLRRLLTRVQRMHPGFGNAPA